MKLTGTEKQTAYANDLIEKMQARIEKLVNKGRTERVKHEIDFINSIQEGDNAGHIINIINEFDGFKMGVERGHATWRQFIEKPSR